MSEASDVVVNFTKEVVKDINAAFDDDTTEDRLARIEAKQDVLTQAVLHLVRTA